MTYDADDDQTHDEIAAIAEHLRLQKLIQAPAPEGVRDFVVTVPKPLWPRWLAEGDLPGDPPEESGLWDFTASGIFPSGAKPGCRVYVVAWGLLRGFAPLVRIEGTAFVRGGGAVACGLKPKSPEHAGPIPGWEEIKGFRSWRYADFSRSRLEPFPHWATMGLPARERAVVEHVLAERAKGPEVRAELRRRALAGEPLFPGWRG